MRFNMGRVVCYFVIPESCDTGPAEKPGAGEGGDLLTGIIHLR